MLSQLGVHVVGVASTIDNDLLGTDISIGCDTAINVALEAIDAHDRYDAAHVARTELPELTVDQALPTLAHAVDRHALSVTLRLNAAGRHHWPPPEDTIALVRELARLMPDRQIARLLNRSGKSTGYGNGWTEQRVRGFRNHHDIAVYRDGEWAERGEITLDAAAQIIGVAKMTALRMLRRGDLKGRQACKGAPWVIKEDDMTAFGTRSPSKAR